MSCAPVHCAVQAIAVTIGQLGERYGDGAVPFWFVTEEIRARRLHIHGDISIGHVYGELRTVRALRRVFAPIRKVLKAASGKWDADRDGDGTQLRFARGTPDIRWLAIASRARTRRGKSGGATCGSSDYRGAGSLL
jgi:hypothetical protein